MGGEAVERRIQFFAIVPGRAQFLHKLFIAGAAVRQLSNVREQSGVVDVARHKRIIESAGIRESAEQGPSQ